MLVEGAAGSRRPARRRASARRAPAPCGRARRALRRQLLEGLRIRRRPDRRPFFHSTRSSHGLGPSLTSGSSSLKRAALKRTRLRVSRATAQ
jgi:hypothetical protein